MGSLSYLRRLRDLEALGRDMPTCPEHRPAPTAVRTVDYRDGLAALSPDAGERAAHEAAQEAAANTPPCTACGWRPPAPIAVRAAIDWNGGHMPDDHDDVKGEGTPW